MKNMKLLKELKCLYCLFKCSKYLYIAKKILCGVTVALVAITALSLFRPDKSLSKSIKGLMH